ncbi:MAG: HAD family hydrolase, partial [Corynebacterium sp.]|nr:HAD family hydrolase [Corynebacterium sp.]
MDGVVTNTARIHATAWKALFDEIISSSAPEQSLFDVEEDYRAYVDGRAREAGVRSFLNAREINVPEGTPEDVAGTFTVHGLAKRKQGFLDEALDCEDVEVFPDTLRLLHRLREQGIPIALVTSSR